MGNGTGKLRKAVRIAGVASCIAIAAACSPIERFHGFVPPERELAMLQVGVSSKAQVIAMFGTPMAERSLENNAIYYASSKFETLGPFAPQEVDRQVLVIEFDARDRLRNISRYTLEDGRIVILERRVTEDGINDVTFLGQLLGSFGRIDAGTFLGEP